MKAKKLLLRSRKPNSHYDIGRFVTSIYGEVGGDVNLQLQILLKMKSEFRQLQAV